MKRSMEPGEWIVVAGMVFVVGVMVASLLPDRFWEPTKPQTLPVAATTPQVGTNALLKPPGQEALRMIPVAAARTPTDGAGAGASGLVLLQQSPTVKFAGTVQQISEQPQSDGQLHLWINGANGQEMRISVGPGWFLKYLGCPLAHDVAVDGSGFSFERNGTSPLIYAKRIRINGRLCQLRNDEGFALWSNKLR
ncbi:MAG: hypothetical protein HQL98_13625 [Magnetococcales bacterium]|nr:hypothetical protein [Magnetococcales bacterium]